VLSISIALHVIGSNTHEHFDLKKCGSVTSV
jgi:hypothetical protein